MIKEKAYSVIDGNASALKTYIEFKKMENELKEAMESIREQAIDEAKKFGAKSFMEEGANIEIRNAGGKWSYNHVGEWAELNTKIGELEKQLQHSYKAKATLIHGDTGEIVEAAHYSEGKETIFVSFKKYKQQA